MRIIPGKTKVQIELFKGVTIADLLVGGLSAAVVLLILTSTIPGKIPMALVLLLVAIFLLIRVDDEPNYIFLLHVLRHIGYRHRYERTFTDPELIRRQAEGTAKVGFETLFAKGKKGKEADKEVDKEAANAYDMAEIMAFTGIHDDLIDYNGAYYGAAIEIPPVEFRFFSNSRRLNSIENCLGQVLRSVPAEYAMNVVKIERPISYDSHLDREYQKLEDLRASYEKGLISEEELKSRVEILYDCINDLRELCYNERVVQPFYYLVLFDSDRQQLQNNLRYAMDLLRNGEMKPHRLNNAELAVFLKYTNQIDFDEREVLQISPEDYALWAMPQSLKFQTHAVQVNHIISHNMRVIGYPTMVGDAWMASVMSIPATKVVVKCRPLDRQKAVRSIDRSLQELRAQWQSTGVDSKRLELEEHIQTLNGVLNTLQGDNETLMEVNIYVTAYDIKLTRETADGSKKTQPPLSMLASIANMKRLVRRTYREQGLRLSSMDFDQVNAFVGGQVSCWDPMHDKGRGIPGNTIAAMYPWIFAHVSDKNGIKLGYESGVPVFIDFFRRDSERVNSNMVIVGKTGSGKSYAAKSLLAHLATDDAKVFVLDPENEYSELAENLHGRFINVGNAQQGRLNPFHIITSLEDDDADSSLNSGSYAIHIQFLEEFFRQIMPDCDRDAMEYLNSLVDRIYADKGITAETDFSRLKPEDYPVFDDLYDTILTEFQSTDNDYIRNMLRTLMTHVGKYATGGRNASLWNGPSTVTTEENFTVFNFQSLLANRNNLVANGQMLLVLKYLDNEIIKNRDYNTKYGLNRKIVVVIDEAHVFIDDKYPVALDFMYQLAKRIRKYNGMQIVITQNIKDFVGSEEIARKSTAIINACQYSFIFGLAPNDMADLCTLYEKAGGINENEQEQIVSAVRGQAFAILSPQSRSTFKVEVPQDVVTMFEQRGYTTHYFNGEDGDQNWENFVAESRQKRMLIDTVAQTVTGSAPVEEETSLRQYVTFQEVTEEEFQAYLRQRTEGDRAFVPETQVGGSEELTEFNLDEAEPEEEYSPAPAAPVAAPAAATRTEEMLGELLSRLSYDAMRAEVQRSVREELQREMAAAAAAGAAVPTAAVPVPTPAPVPAAVAPQEEQPQSSGGTALGSIFNEDAMREAARLLQAEEQNRQPEAEFDFSGGMAESDEDQGSEEFDIMDLLAAEAEKQQEISPIEVMETYDEPIIEITLEELIAYNAKNQK